MATARRAATSAYVDNAVQANLLAATTQNAEAVNQVYNVAVGERTTLNELYAELQPLAGADFPASAGRQADIPRFPRRRRAPQPGGHRQRLLAPGLCAYQRIGKGLELAMPWYAGSENLNASLPERSCLAKVGAQREA